MNQTNLDVVMVRPNLQDIPQCEIKEGYRIRCYRPGDEEAWVRIHDLADEYNKVTVAAFRENFGSDLQVLRSRGFYLDSPDGETVGTATAWYNLNFEGKDWGRVHWVAITPEHQGKGVSKPLLSAVMNRLAQSHERAYLTTSTARIPAIHLYLTFGFHPYFGDPDSHTAWATVRQVLQHPLLDM